MSTATTLTARVHYKDQLKLVRAETATAWMIASFRFVKDALRTVPPPSATVLDEEAPSPQRHYGAFHC